MQRTPDERNVATAQAVHADEVARDRSSFLMRVYGHLMAAIAAFIAIEVAFFNSGRPNSRNISGVCQIKLPDSPQNKKSGRTSISATRCICFSILSRVSSSRATPSIHVIPSETRNP